MTKHISSVSSLISEAVSESAGPSISSGERWFRRCPKDMTGVVPLDDHVTELDRSLCELSATSLGVVQELFSWEFGVHCTALGREA